MYAAPLVDHQLLDVELVGVGAFLLGGALLQAADLFGEVEEGDAGRNLGGIGRETGSHPQWCGWNWGRMSKGQGGIGRRLPAEIGEVFMEFSGYRGDLATAFIGELFPWG